MRVLYLHGFASGPRSKKGVAVEARLAARGIAVERLDLRVPSLERLSLGAAIERTRAAIDGPTILIGSSLGGLTATLVAEHEPRVIALALLAPAFDFASRVRARVGPDGWLDVHDYTTGLPARVHGDFAREAEALGGWPDVHVPTLIVHGSRDEVVPVELSRRYVAAHPAVRLIEVDDGHDLLATLPLVLDEVDTFVSAHVPA